MRVKPGGRLIQDCQAQKADAHRPEYHHTLCTILAPTRCQWTTCDDNAMAAKLWQAWVMTDCLVCYVWCCVRTDDGGVDDELQAD